MTMKMSSHNLIYIVTDRCKTKCPVHMVMIGPEQFVHWLETNIINEDDSIMGLVDALVVELWSWRSRALGERPTILWSALPIDWICKSR